MKHKKVLEAPAAPPTSSSCSSVLCCCVPGDVQEYVLQELSETAAALRASPPLDLLHGYANEDGQDIHPPVSGMLEVVNKSKKNGEIIGVLVAENACDLVRRRHRDIQGHLDAIAILPDHTVRHATFSPTTTDLQIVLFYGAKYHSIEEMSQVKAIDSFHHIRGYQVKCHGKNVLLKYKEGSLELQRGMAISAFSLIGQKKAVGSGIDMKTNIEALQPVHMSTPEPIIG
mmetsp:Transcript_46614/g.77057  ORF Transcript_46614/g.77057 Transcript_46614/m.77057 type:complete len:229 (+) Transcript_46614:62-748(+)|eukprot:CAMPEP_0119310016 /NCGR_PEP_ID=MMETSP1333-20130426/17655_1 /TAXON_ID=418940 /ORGANISM="Scyphosphaera apsteinii, Strain RCC1455" /LENGTH=228 /DNA_ID=CAMNT_0007314131 /DNA_START=52 /DNA_END=738 /DNA_ORIENTATION=+